MGMCVSGSRIIELEKDGTVVGKKLTFYLFRLELTNNSEVNGVIIKHYFAQVSVHTNETCLTSHKDKVFIVVFRTW
jgi:hypothetical protein